MQRPSTSDLLFWLLALLSAFALAVLVLVLAGALPIDPAPEPEPEPAAEQAVAPATSTRATTAAAARPAAPPRAGTTTAPAASTAPEAEPAPAPERAVVVVTAVRGDSWVSARVGSESGDLLDERLLEQGDSLRLEAPRVWLSLGAAGNVDVTVNGEPRTLGNGTIASVLAPDADDASGAG